MERKLKRVKTARLNLMWAREETRGRDTAGLAKFWKQQIQWPLQSAP
jgi:hypothetical protein